MDSVEEPQRLVPVAGGLDGEAFAGQPGRQGLAVGLLVVDHQDQGAVVPTGTRGREPAGVRRCVRDGHWDPLRRRRGAAGVRPRSEGQATTADGGMVAPTSPGHAG